MKITRLVTLHGAYNDSIGTIDAKMHGATFREHQHGILVTRKNQPTALVPWSNIKWMALEEEVKTEPQKPAPKA